MVALLVRLKLTLLRNSLRRSVWRMVGLIIGMVYGLGVVAGVYVGMVALRWTSVGLTADVTVVAFALLTAGWLVMSLLVFGVDETVDPAKFALLPVRARQLLPGLLVAGLVGVPGVATVLVSFSLVVTWTRTVPLALASLVAVPLGVLTCFLLSRAATAAFASVLSSRRFRDVALVALALSGAVFGLGGNLIGSFGGSDIDALRGRLAGVATVLGWTPFGWAWAIPADLALGRWVAAGVHLVLAVVLVAGLWRAWGYFLARRLVSPIEAGGAVHQVREGTLVERLFPATPAGGVAGRTLRYWRRDPRYLAGIAGFLVAPVIILVGQLLNPYGSAEVAVLAPSLLGLLVGLSVAQDLSYDGSALWLHITTGLSGAEDRVGRVRSTLTIYGPLLVVMTVVALVATGEWTRLPIVVGLTVSLTLIGLGVGSLVGALWQWPAPPPGANPFQRGNSGGLPALLSFTVTLFGTLILGLPTVGLAIWSYFTPWIGYLTLPVGLVSGLVALRIGIAQGGKILDRRWPEVLTAVSERSA